MIEYSTEGLQARFPLAQSLFSPTVLAAPSRDWDKIRDAMADLAERQPWRKLSEWIPALAACDAPLDLLLFCRQSDVEHPKTRTSTVLNAQALTDWRSLGGFSVVDIRDWRGSGLVTIRDLLRICFEFGLRQSPVALAVRLGLEQQGGESSSGIGVSFPIEAVKLLGEWTAALGLDGRVADLIDMSDQGCVPQDVRAAIDELSAWDLRVPSRGWGWVQSDLDGLMEGFDPRQLQMFGERVLADSPKTLDQVGLDFGVTRERVRQIVERLSGQVHERLESVRFRGLRWLGYEVTRKSGGLLSVSSGAIGWPGFRDALEALDERSIRIFLILVCRMELEQEWWVLQETRDARQSIIAEVFASGSLSHPTALAKLPARLDPRFAREFLVATKQVRWFEETLLPASCSMEAIAVIVLRTAGRPLALETIHQKLTSGWRPGASESGLRNALLSSAQVSRCSSFEWALNEWGLATYSGVTDSIQREIEAAGGVCDVESMVARIVAADRVAESTVRAYLKAPRFSLESSGTAVRLRRPDEPFPVMQKLLDVSGVFAHGALRISWLIELNDESFRGSGRLLPMALAKRLGLEPCGERVFITNTGRVVRVTWPDSAWQGAYLGSTRELLADLQCDRDELLRIDFDIEGGTANAERVPNGKPAQGEVVHWLALRTGCHGLTAANARESVARALGVSQDDVFTVLCRRGEGAIAQELQGLAGVDFGFGEALDYLGKALG